jgi:CHAT domain-containing protein
VPVKETVELMVVFYTNWLNGKSIEDSLNAAQAEMRKKYPSLYLAAFVLVE